MKNIKKFESFNQPSVKIKNDNITIGDLGEERKFVGGVKNWGIEWAEIYGERFSVGDMVEYIDEDDNVEYKGLIDWMVVTGRGDVEVSIKDTPLGRVDLEDIKHIK